LNVAYDSIFSIDTAEAASIDSVALMRPGAVTHNFDQNQRYIPLFFSRQGNRLNVTSPVDGNMAPPGYYMLFI
ncbi:MAG: DUF1929 domain-containing protein, partial [Actinobacteria bacterium]|nr:DUF1929 domain-containing protein [Actinomycetota bacterium]NIS31862.1 DUF1929 domain-containing protein [Actinomycetota bacterium]NIT95928.1 DUF1929 domain-containing protein [Actinomycetota bacterium]NIU19607.1 DUF1929 domain-containing protein [Actinomycetota bacterium]NIV56100.1 DUF1929 domain-containing protein [Actinomycetota bacterium]